MTINITELTKLQAIRKEIVQRMIKLPNVGHYGIFYLILPCQGKKLTQAMIYSFDEDYLFLDALQHKLEGLYKPGDSIRYYHSESKEYRLIQDDFSFYAVVLHYFKHPVDGRCIMDFFINGSELLIE